MGYIHGKSVVNGINCGDNLHLDDSGGKGVKGQI